MPYKPLSALISGSLAKLGSCTGTSGQYHFSATMFLFDKDIAFGEHEISGISLKKKSEKRNG